MLNQDGQKLLFTDARTYGTWQDKEVEESTLKSLYDLMKFAPTSANCCPMRVRFLVSDESKARLRPFLDEGNVEKTMNAPVTAIFAKDMEFYQHMPKLFPHADAKSWFVGNQSKIEETAYRNGSLQAAYFIMAARAVGLDCGPMSGFDSSGVNEEFFKGTQIIANFLCNLGYGDDSGLHPRLPRFDFEEVCEIL